MERVTEFLHLVYDVLTWNNKVRTTPQRLAAAPSWTRTRTPLVAIARPIRRRSLAPVARAGAGGARSACHTRRPPARAKPGVGGTGGSGARTRRCC